MDTSKSTKKPDSFLPRGHVRTHEWMYALAHQYPNDGCRPVGVHFVPNQYIISELTEMMSVEEHEVLLKRERERSRKFAELVEGVLECGFRQPELSDEWYENAEDAIGNYRASAKEGEEE